MLHHLTAHPGFRFVTVSDTATKLQPYLKASLLLLKAGAFAWSLFVSDITNVVSQLDHGLDALAATAAAGQAIDVAQGQLSAVNNTIGEFSKADLDEQDALLSGESIAPIKKEIDGETQLHSDFQVRGMFGLFLW